LLNNYLQHISTPLVGLSMEAYYTVANKTRGASHEK